MRAYNCFLFDADGTLFDYHAAEQAALQNTFGAFGIPFAPEYQLAYETINAALWKSYEKGEVSKEVFQVLRFFRFFKQHGFELDAAEFNKVYLCQLGEQAQLMDGALELCSRLYTRGKSIYLITNGIAVSQRARLARSAIRPYIRDIFISDEIGFAKPHPAYFAYVQSHLPGVSKTEMLVVGDSLSADIAGGDNFGLDTCWYNPKKIVPPLGIAPTYEIHRLSELKNA